MPVHNKVDTAAIQVLEKLLTDTIGAVLGIPKSQLNREPSLNRDIATIELIQFIKYIRKPDERHVSKIFEDQLLNPMFAYLCGKPLSQLPIRIKIVPNKDPDEIIDGLMEQKVEEIQKAEIEQSNTTIPG